MTRADNTHHLQRAATARHDAALQRARGGVNGSGFHIRRLTKGEAQLGQMRDLVDLTARGFK